MIQVVLIDIDNTLLSFSGYIKEAMRDGFAQYGLKPYTEAMFPVFERINNSLWEQIEQGTLSFEKLTEIRWNMIFHALGISFDGRIFERYFRDKLFSFKELRGSGFPNLLPEETMIIGDSLSSDIAGGAGYGMHTCLYQKKPVPALDVSRAEHVVRSLAEIQRIL